jgi:hypothetical protein
MTDEYKRQTEYWARAAQAAGWPVDVDRRLGTGIRPDALIYGSVVTGIEVQLTRSTADSAVARTRSVPG